jgi:NADPH-dependent 2,4-dienoyl-CoA reductase/sulfur reductase-like enzyme
MAIRAEHLPALPVEPIPDVPAGLRVAYAKHLLHKHLADRGADFKKNVSFSKPSREGKRPDADLSHGPEKDKVRIAIVGAGATGLYLAMLLKSRKYNNVDIYEASDRIGGRCYTYNFPDDKDCPHNYYDIGAMRIPQIPAMQSLVYKRSIVH